MASKNVLPPEGWYSPRELAAKMGYHRRTIYGWISSGLIEKRYIKYTPTNRLRIHVDGVLRNSPRKS